MGFIDVPEDGTRGAFKVYFKDLRAFNWFLKESEVDGSLAPAEVRTKEIPGHQRRRGPSDVNPINVTQSNATYLFDPSLKSGNALPGNSFVLQTMASSDFDATRQFTLQGRTVDFTEYFKDKFKYDTYVYWSHGGRHTFLIQVGGAVTPG
jgi:hypothetical protein